MWQSTILSYSNSQGVLIVSVQYSNGDDSFIESMDMSGQTIDTLTDRVQSKISLLNSNDDLVSNLDIKIPDSFVIQAAVINKVETPVDMGISSVVGS